MPDSGRKGKTRDRELSGAGQVEVLVDNEIAVQNLTKNGRAEGYQSSKEAGGSGISGYLYGGEQTEEEKAQAEPDAKPVFRTAVPIPWL